MRKTHRIKSISSGRELRFLICWLWLHSKIQNSLFHLWGTKWTTIRRTTLKKTYKCAFDGVTPKTGISVDECVCHIQFGQFNVIHLVMVLFFKFKRWFTTEKCTTVYRPWYKRARLVFQFFFALRFIYFVFGLDFGVGENRRHWARTLISIICNVSRFVLNLLLSACIQT